MPGVLRVIWFGLALLLLVLYRSHLLDGRWIGLAFGLIFALLILVPLTQLRTYQDKYLSRRDCLRLGILEALVGLYATGKFVVGGSGLEGFGGLLMMAWGIQYLYFYRIWNACDPEDGKSTVRSA